MAAKTFVTPTSDNHPLMPAEAGLTETEAETLAMRLLPLLDQQMRKKTQGDSASMRVEGAAELMASIQFTLQCQLTAQALPKRALLTADLGALFGAGQRTVLALRERAQRLYETVCVQVHQFGSRSLADTLRGIGIFFARYDAYLYAHQIPADIDYQLCLPVPDALLGVVWVTDYMQRLMVENTLLTSLESARVVRLLRRVHPSYGELLINLYEPVAANVVGLSLLGSGETLLEIDAAQGERIRNQLLTDGDAAALTALERAAYAACKRLDIADAASARYLAATARALYPRVKAAPEGYRGVFVTR